MKKPKILSSETLFDGHFKLIVDRLENGESQTDYARCVISYDAAVILAETSDGKFILNREYRHPLHSYILGLPGGSIQTGEDILAGGLREFHEETGYWSEHISHLGTTYQMPGICNQKVHFLWAKNAQCKGQQKLDPFEFIQIELKTEAEIRSEKSLLDSHILVALALRQWAR